MHAALRRSSKISWRTPARTIAGRRFPARPLHSSPAPHRPIFPWTSDAPHDEGRPREESAAPPPRLQHRDDASKPPADAGASNGRERGYGSAARRWMRNRRPKDLPPIQIPAWFYERNVRLREEEGALTDGALELVPSDEVAAAEQKAVHDVHGGTEEVDDGDDRVYRISAAVMAELVASMSAGLSMSSADGSETFASGKSHLKLHCPVDGGIYMVEKAVEEAARQLHADIIRIDAQDLAEIAGDYIKEGPDATANSLWSLGYDAQQIFPRQSAAENDEAEDAEGEGDEEASFEDDEKESRSPKQPQFTVTAIPAGQLSDILKKMRGVGSGSSSSGASSGRGANNPAAQLFGGNGGGNWAQGMPIEMPFPNPFQAQNNGAPQWNDLKLNALLEGLLEANHAKRFDPVPPSGAATQPTSGAIDDVEPGAALQDSSDQASGASEPIRARTVILIRGFKELAVPQQGRLLLEKIQQLVQKQRKEGQATMIVGATASADLTPELSREAFETLQNDGQQTPFRTMVVTPDEAGPAGGLYFADAGRRIRAINTRHLFALLARLSPGAGREPPADLPAFARGLRDFGAAASADAERAARLSALLDDQVLTFDEVHRIVLTALGAQAAAEGDDAPARAALEPADVVRAMALLEGSDRAKTEWARHETALEDPPEDAAAKQQAAQAKKAAGSGALEARLRKIRKTATSHEKVLMRGVVDPASIHTTFADVHAPPETVEALKTLTTLTLTRPEAFTYGVLATDKITGVLLYGPPGTGKTLLARAVAKESGATVLEVSGSDVYDMYVGESEKNVRAIFSLARKLTPCVVFVDEADAIFASRGAGTSRNTHRELINQFLREWDGMREAGAVMMVATNRPFDLDDAALRRLPRRLLVDLPAEADRARILAIHTAGEQLAPGVELGALAAATPLYSGSDLKNLVVAAALAAVREENELVAAATAAATDSGRSDATSADADGATSADASDAPSRDKNDTTSEDRSKSSYTLPARRTLHQHHFDKALQEITASVSDDMSSLGAIRKFDDKYGDKRGRRRRASYGFGGRGEGVREDAAKVRA